MRLKAPAPKPDVTPGLSKSQSISATAVENFTRRGEHLPLEQVPAALDGFLDQNVAQLQAVRDGLKVSFEGQRALAAHQSDGLWRGPATADKVVKLLAGDVPTTPEEATRQLSDAVCDRYARMAERDALRAKGAPEALAVAEERLAAASRRVDTLRDVHHQLEGVERPSALESTGVMVGLSLSTGLPGLGGASAEVGVGVRPQDRHSHDRKVYPYASVGAGTPVVGGGYTWSKEPGSSGKGLGFSVPYFGFTQDKQHGKRVSAFVPNVASFQMTERGEVGFSFAVPVAPFVQVGFSCFIENPAIARITGPAVRGLEKVIGPAARAVGRAVTWVKEHVLHKGPDPVDLAQVAPAAA